MGGSRQVSGLLAAFLSVGALLLTALPRDTGAIEAWRARVATGLQSVYDTATPVPAGPANNAARFDAQGRVEADVHYDCSSSVPTAALTAAGLTPSGTTHLPPLCVVEGWVAPTALPKVAAVAGVTRVKIPSYVRH